MIPHATYTHYRNHGVRRLAPADTCNLLFFGLVRPVKGLEDLVDAFGRIPADEIEHYWLTIVGETWEGWTLPFERIEASPYRDRISIVNRYVSDAEVDEFFGGADAVVLPYRQSSQSGVLHVAMAYGLPIVATRVGGLSEALEGYGPHVLAEAGDCDSLLSSLRAVRHLEATAERLRSAMGRLRAPAPLDVRRRRRRCRRGHRCSSLRSPRRSPHARRVARGGRRRARVADRRGVRVGCATRSSSPTTGRRCSSSATVATRSRIRRGAWRGPSTSCRTATSSSSPCATAASSAVLRRSIAAASGKVRRVSPGACSFSARWSTSCSPSGTQILARGSHDRRAVRRVLEVIQADTGWDWVELSLAADQGWFEPNWIDASSAAKPFVVHKTSRPSVGMELPGDLDALQAGAEAQPAREPAAGPESLEPHRRRMADRGRLRRPRLRRRARFPHRSAPRACRDVRHGVARRHVRRRPSTTASCATSSRAWREREMPRRSSSRSTAAGSRGS